MADQHQRFLAEGNDLEPAVAGGVSHQAQVHHVAQDVLVNLVVPAIFHVHVHRRVILQKPLQVGRQHVQPDAVNGRHPDVPGNDPLQLLQPAVQGVETLQDPLAVFVKHLALGREPEILLAPLDEQGLELLFESADRLADGGLGHLVDLRSLGKTLRFRQVAKNL